jgi:hypothetical protein
MTSLALTRHASVRANQRGVTNSMLETLIAHADIEAAVGGGCTVLRLSRQSLRDGELRVSLGPSLDRLGPSRSSLPTTPARSSRSCEITVVEMVGATVDLNET